LFGLTVKWKHNRLDRLTRLAERIDAASDRDRKLVADATQVEELRVRGAAELHEILRGFVDKLNGKLSDRAVLLDPPRFSRDGFDDDRNLFQINLRGRLLQVEFASTDSPTENDDFKRPYILRGTVRSFNQDLLLHNTVDEQLIFYCPDRSKPDGAEWYFFDERTYRTGRVGEEYLITEMERLL
jgi:hypothetical protein